MSHDTIDTRLCEACGQWQEHCQCKHCEGCGNVALDAEPLDADDLCENCAQSKAEAAYEAYLSNYYGGSGPITDAEHLAAAQRLK